MELLQSVARGGHAGAWRRRVRAVLITGEGKNFCAGGDVHTFLSKGEELPHYIRVATSYAADWWLRDCCG
jgi:enoyl-CoA hydratase/carnithine racemase